MNKNINSNTLGIIGSFVLLVAVVAGFLWLWNGTNPGSTSASVATANYQKVNIDADKSIAEKLLSDRNTSAVIPVKSPSADAIGKTNPFTP